MECQCEFTVLAHKNAPTPEWKMSQLIPSTINEFAKSTGVTIQFKNSALTKSNSTLEYKITAYDYYSFGADYKIEVFLDGAWYCVPFANGVFLTILYSISPGADASITHFCDPVFAIGVLPKGRYRLIKGFNQVASGSLYLSCEYAIAEFTVAETLEPWI
jgi:hypothetical protein